MTKKKKKIIEAVIETLSENFNYDEFSMSKIAEKVGIGKSTIYEYFDSKSDLLIETIKGIVDLYIKQILIHDLTNLNFHDAFVMQILNIIECDFNKNAVFHIFTQLDLVVKVKEKEIKEKMEDAKKKVLERFAYIFHKGVEEKIITASYDAKTEALISGLLSTMICRQINNSIGANEEIAEYLYNVVVKILN